MGTTIQAQEKLRVDINSPTDLTNASDGIVKRLPALATPAGDVNVQILRKNTP